jgi:hypothetical protein
MNYREETYLLNTVKDIKKTVDENNKMLRFIVQYIGRNISGEPNEEIKDFGRNVLANIVSNKFNR